MPRRDIVHVYEIENYFISQKKGALFFNRTPFRVGLELISKIDLIYCYTGCYRPYSFKVITPLSEYYKATTTSSNNGALIFT